MTFTFIRQLLLLITLFLSSFSFSGELFWIGGGGLYSDPLHWSLTSGGVSAGITPTATDTIYFDDNSVLTAASIVDVDIAIDVHSIFAENISNSFIMNASTALNHVVFGSIRGNAAGIDFTGAWGVIQLFPINANSVQSSGVTWIQDFSVDGDTLTFTDDFNITNGNLTILSGIVSFSPATTVTAGSFLSNTNNIREIQASNVLFIMNLGQWELGGNNLLFTGATANVQLGQTAGLAIFNGGGQNYGNLTSSVATSLEMLSSSNFGIISLLNSSNFLLDAGITIGFDSLNAQGFCNAELLFEKIGGGPNPQLQKLGFPDFSITGLNVINVNAVTTGNAEIIFGDIIGSSAGWTLGSGKFYWIGNSGSWNVGTNWSLSSGGAPVGCVPSIADSVIFDGNSFASANSTVNVLDTAYAKVMIWGPLTGAQTLLLDSNLYIQNDIVLHTDVSFLRAVGQAGVVQVGTGVFNVNNANVDVNLYNRMGTNTDNWTLNGDLIMSDTTSLLMINGVFTTNNFNMELGSIVSLNDPGSALDTRELNFGSSTIHLAQRFATVGDTDFTLNAGNSHLFIIDTTSFEKAILTEGVTFYDVTIFFKPLNLPNRIGGDNVYNKLKILGGSDVEIVAGSQQLVNDSLSILGTCFDSVFVKSSGAGQALLNKTGLADQYRIECVNFEGIDANGEVLDVFFSTDITNNSGITFNTSLAATSSFTADGPFCFRDTTLFTNNSTAISGDPNDLTYRWYFNDGSGLDTANNVFYYPDTTSHVFLLSDSIAVTLEVEYINGCKSSDTNFVVITRPQFFTSTNTFGNNVCPGHYLEINSSSGSSTLEYEYFLNGTSVQGPSVNDTLFSTINLQDEDSIVVIAYDQGCTSDTSYLFTYNVYPVPTYSFTASVTPQEICAGDTISFAGASLETLQYRFLVNDVGVTPFQPAAGAYSSSALQNDDTVYMIVNDQYNCKDTSSVFVITVNPLPTTSLDHSAAGNSICSGDTILFTALGASTYEFFVDGVSQQGPLALNTWSTTTLNQGEVVSVIGYSAAGCEFEAPQTFSYFVTPAPATVLTSNLGSSVCDDDVVVFTGSGATSYEFLVNGITVQASSTDNTFDTQLLLDTDEVTVIGSALGCSSTASPIQMTVSPSPTTTLTNDLGVLTICQGTEVVFTALGATNYQFFLNGTSLGVPSTANTYTTSALTNGDVISVTGGIGSCSNSMQQQFNVQANPVVEVFSTNATNIICDGDPITFIASGAQDYTFSIDGAVVQGPSTANSLVNPVLTNGLNEIQVVGTAANGCSTSSAVLEVQNNPNPVVNVSVGSNVLCAGESVLFTATGGDSYQFLLNGSPQTGLSPSATYSTSAIVDGDEITVIGSLNGCSSVSNLITMNVNPIPLVSITNDLGSNQYCEDILVTYTASGAGNYEFFINGGSQGAPSALNTINSSSFPTGTVNLTVVGESLGCSATANSTINMFPLPVADVTTVNGLTEFCDGEIVVFEASGGSEYEFFVNGASATVPSFLNSYSAAFANGDVVGVEVTSVSGCSSSASFPALTIFPNPNISITGSNSGSTICTGDAIDIEAFGGLTYEFFLNGGSLGVPSATSLITLSNLQTGDEVVVVGSNANCSATSNTLSFTSFGIPNVNLINLLPSNEVCIDEPVNLQANGAANYQFFINGTPVGGFSTLDSFNQLVNNGDQITVIGELNGCESLPSSPVVYTVYSYPTISVVNDAAANTICFGDTVTFTVAGALEYQFEVNGLLTEVNSAGTWSTDALENADEVGVTGFNGQCPSTISLTTFTVNSMTLDLAVTPSSFICEGDLVTFTGSGADLYEFLVNNTQVQASSPDNTFDSNTLTSSDVVTFIATNTATGCVQGYHDFIVMTVVEEPTITANGPLQFCDGDSVLLTSNSTYGNQWLVDGLPIAGATNDSLIAFVGGAYTLETTKGGTGEFWSVGKNSSGVHGNGNNFNSLIAETTIPQVQLTSFASGYEFVIGKSQINDVYAWGKNSSGQLGNGTFTSSTTPLLLAGVSDADCIAATRSSAMVSTNAGDVYVWGENNSGQLGLGNLSVVNFPLINPSISNVDTIAGGLEHFVILRNDGTVWTVGNNDQGQLGNNSLVNALVPVQVSGLTNIVAIGAGEYHSFAIGSDGTLYGWGNNSSGQLGLGNLDGQLVPAVLPLEGIIAATGGANHSAFLSNSGEVFTCGGNLYGQLGINTTAASTIPKKAQISGVKQLVTSQYTTLFLRNDFSVYGCGNNDEGQLSPETNLVVTAPALLSIFEGATFIGASQHSTHIIYGVSQGCSSTTTNVIVDPVPQATISADGDTLTTIPGVTYQWYFNGLPIPNEQGQSMVATSNGDYSVVVGFGGGCASESDSYTHQLVNISDILKEVVTIYPNPTENVLHVQGVISQFKQVLILDNTGREVLRADISQSSQLLELNTSALVRGGYHLILVGDNDVYRTKFMKN